jgi:hypothetical protein
MKDKQTRGSKKFSRFSESGRLGRTFILIALLCLLTIVRSPVLAQSYSFAVPDLNMQVYVQTDASVRIIYDITFKNYGQTIDIVDIGMPNANYNLNNMRASVGGVNLSDIRKSEYVNPGVEVHLGSQSIRSGETGTLHFEFAMPNMVYQDTTDKDMASLQITPTWFDDEFVQGTSTIRIAIHMPPGIKAEEMLYQKAKFTDRVDNYQGHAVAVWQWEDTRATKSHLVGISFPKRVMNNVVKMTIFQLVAKWFNDNPAVRFIMLLADIVLFIFLFFRFSGGTGFSVFVVLGGGLFLLLLIAPILSLVAIPILIVLIILNENNLKSRKAGKKTYLPPIAQVEGGGIKRGLTAPEAAALLEMPLNKVLTLVIFGLLEKGVLEQVEASPLQVEVAEDYRTLNDKTLNNATQRAKQRYKVAQANGTVIHKYEHPFLEILEQNPAKPVQALDFSSAMKSLITGTANKMKGFDLSDTQDYYRRIIDRAWKKAESIEEVPEREKFLDRYFPWVILNNDYPTVMTHRGYHYWPRWVRRSPRWRPATSGGGLGGKSSKGGTSSGGRTTMGDVAGSFAGWAENTMGGMAAAILPGTLQVSTPKGGVIDLSGVDKVTGDFFEALAKSSSSGGGGGGSCACACAGCACACACAGGGR